MHRFDVGLHPVLEALWLENALKNYFLVEKIKNPDFTALEMYHTMYIYRGKSIPTVCDGEKKYTLWWTEILVVQKMVSEALSQLRFEHHFGIFQKSALKISRFSEIFVFSPTFPEPKKYF